MFTKGILLAIFVATVDQTLIDPVVFVGPLVGGGGLASFPGGPSPPELGIVPPIGEVPRRAHTPLASAQPEGGLSPPPDQRPSPGQNPIQNQPVRTGSPASPPKQQEQDRTMETVRQQAVGGGPASSAGGPLPPAVGIATAGGEAPRRTGTPEGLLRPGDERAPPREGRPSPVPRPIVDPSVLTGPPKTSPKQEQDRPGSQAPRRTGTPEALVRQADGPIPTTEGRPSPVPGPIEERSVRTGPAKSSPKQEQDRPGSEAPPRTGTPEALVRPGDGPAPPTEGRPSPVSRPIEDPSVRSGPVKTSPKQEQDRPGNEGPRRTGTPEALVRPGDGPAPTTAGRPSPVPSPKEEPSVRTGPAKSSPKQKQDRPGSEAPRRIGTPEALVRPGDGPAPTTEGRPSPVPSPIEEPSVRTGPAKSSPKQEQDRPGSEAPRRTGTPEALVRQADGPAPTTEGRLPPVPSPIEEPSVRTGPAKSSPKQEQDRPGSEAPSRTGTPEELVRSGDGPVPPTEGRPSPDPRPIGNPSVRSGPVKTSPKQEQDRPGSQAPRRTGTPEALARQADGPIPTTEGRPSPVPGPIEEPSVRTGPAKSSPKQEQDRPGSEAPRRTGTPEALVRPGDGPAPPTEGRPSPVPRPIEDPSVRTGPVKTSPKQEQDRPGSEGPRRTGTPQALVRPGDGPTPTTEGRPSPVPSPIEEPSVRTGPAKSSPKQGQDRPGSEAPRRTGTPEALVRQADGPAPTTEGRPPPVPSPIEEPSVRTGPAKSSPKQEQDRPGSEAPSRTGTPEELVRSGDGPVPPTEGRPSPDPRPIDNPSVRSGPVKTSPKQEQDRPGSDAPRRTGTPEALVRQADGPAPTTEGRPSPVPSPIEERSVRTGPAKSSPKQEQDRPGSEAPRRTGTPEALVRSEDGPAPPTEGRPSPLPRPIEDTSVRTGPAKTSPKQEQDRPGIEAPRRTGTPEALVRQADGPAPTTEGRPPPVPSPTEEPSVRTGPAKSSPKQEQDRPGSEGPRRTGTPEALVRPGDGPAPPTEDRPSPVPRPIEEPSVRTGPAKTSPKQEQDRPGIEAPRRTGTPEALVRQADGPAPTTEGRPPPVPSPTEEPSVRTGPAKSSPKQEQDRPGSEGPRRTGTPEALVRPGDGPAPPTEDRPSPVPRPIEEPSVRTGPAKTSPKQEQDRPGIEAPRRTGTPEALVRQADGPAPTTEGRPPPVPSPTEEPSVRTGPAKSSPKQEQDRPGSEGPRRTGTPEALVRPGDGPAPPTEDRPSPVPRPIEEPSVRTGPAKTSPKQEQDRPGGGPAPSAGGSLQSAVGIAPPDGEAARRTGTPEELVRPGDGPAPPADGRPSPVPRPTEDPSVWTGPPKTSPKQEEDRPVETVRPQTVRGSPEPSTVGVLPPDGERRTGTPLAFRRPGDRPFPLTEERLFPGPRPIQHPPVWTGSPKTSSKQQEQYRPIQHPPVWTGLPKTSPTRQQENEAGPPAEGATPRTVGRPTPSPRPIQHPPVWTGPRKTQRKQQQRQQEPVREQEVEEPRRGRPNLQKSSNPLPVTTPPTTVPTNPPRIPFSTKEFAVTTPPTTVPINPPSSQPCSIAAVCGSDGYTYFSECFLPDGVWKECDGSCPCPVQNPQPSHPPVSACTCPKIYNPVCGVDGNTYDNDCWRRCNYVAKDCEDHCPCDRPFPTIEPVSCSCKNKEYNPVCSVFGNAYDNECELRCSGESKQCDNECPCTQEKSVTHSECVCNPFETDPVCTTDGETIWNGCEAMCAGKEIACTSTCPC